MSWYRSNEPPVSSYTQRPEFDPSSSLRQSATSSALKVEDGHGTYRKQQPTFARSDDLRSGGFGSMIAHEQKAEFSCCGFGFPNISSWSLHQEAAHGWSPTTSQDEMRPKSDYDGSGSVSGEASQASWNVWTDDTLRTCTVLFQDVKSYVMYNETNPLLSPLEVKKALDSAISKIEIADQAWKGRPAGSPYVTHGPYQGELESMLKELRALYVALPEGKQDRSKEL